jgi:hypothetical protein
MVTVTIGQQQELIAFTILHQLALEFISDGGMADWVYS